MKVKTTVLVRSINQSGQSILKEISGQELKIIFLKNKKDWLVLDTIFDTFTYIVTDIGTIEEGDTDYLKANKETNELLLLFFSPNQTKRFCV